MLLKCNILRLKIAVGEPKDEEAIVMVDNVCIVYSYVIFLMSVCSNVH